MNKSAKLNTLFNSHRMLKIVLIMILVGGLAFIIIVARVTYIATSTSKKVVNATRIGNADGNTKLNIIVALSQQVNRSEIDKLITDIDNDFGSKKHNSMKDVINNTGASQQTIDNVVDYFNNQGLNASIDATRTYASIPMTANQAKKIFKVSFSQYQEQTPDCQNNNNDNPSCKFIALSPSSSLHIPKQLKNDLAEGKSQQQIAGLENRKIFKNNKTAGILAKTATKTAQNTAPLQQPPLQTTQQQTPPTSAIYDSSNLNSPPWWLQSGTPSGCAASSVVPQDNPSAGFSPSQLKTAYDFPTDTPKVKQSVVLVSLSQTVDQGAVDIFANCFNITGSSRPTITLEPISTSTNGYTEATGDAQTLTAFGAGAIDNIIVINGNTDNSTAGFFDVLSKATTQKDSSGNNIDIISISYGACEDQFETQFGTSLNITETILAKAALANITISAATGDNGSTECTWPSEPNTLSVLYPGSSAYVTAVGATNLFLDKNNTIVSSGSWNDAYLMQDGGPFQGASASGGGVSKYISKPTWQIGSGVSLTSKRQVPDISYYGDVYPGLMAPADCNDIIPCSDPYWSTFFGTSLAAPIFASITAQYNVRHNDAHLGFANKKLYTAINSGKVKTYDITHNNNITAGSYTAIAFVPNPSITCCTAKPKYDTASGWGSIYVQSLIDNL